MSIQSVSGPVMLIILDGWGRSTTPIEKNPIELAKTPVMHKLWDTYAHTELQAAGSMVGLLPGQDGNSEAGHMNIGAGRIVDQDVIKISKSIENKTFFKNPAFLQAVRHVKEHNSDLHIMGLLSDEHSGHSNPDHIRALLQLFREQGVTTIYLHLFTDGRDTPKFASLGLVAQLESFLWPHEHIVTIIGRNYAMDRKKDWSHTQLAYDTLTGVKQVADYSDVQTAIQQGYSKGESDEFLLPRVIGDHPEKTRIKDNDAVVFFNLRSDRARQLAKPFVQKRFTESNPHSFDRTEVLENLLFVAMTDFGPDLGEILTAYPSEDLSGTLPMALSEVRQVYIAESEKFAHVTYFLNGGHDAAVGGEQRVNIPSPAVSHYDTRPEMSLHEIVSTAEEMLDQSAYDFYAINMANADMVGHTGNLEACITAVQAIDMAVDRLVKKVLEKKGVICITADHGNVEEVINATTGDIDTEHSSNPVPFILVGEMFESDKLTADLASGALANVAPTILDVMNISKPAEMTAESLLKAKS